jgi:hypothetical protein
VTDWRAPSGRYDARLLVSTLGKILPLAAAVLGVLVLASTASAKVTTQGSSSGGVTATLSYNGVPPSVKNMRLKIVRLGKALYDQPVRSRFCGKLCAPAFAGSAGGSVRVLDIESDGQPDVILQLFTGGANCCLVDQVFSFGPAARTYIKSERNFSSNGAAIRKIAGHWRFQSSDPAFDCAFTDCADSGAPIQMWRFGGRRRFMKVTVHYPRLISKDAAKWMRLFKQHISNGVGLIAAWAADEELLGRHTLVKSTLAAEAAKGALRADNSGEPGGKKFVVALNRLLRRRGYLK